MRFSQATSPWPWLSLLALSSTAKSTIITLSAFQQIDEFSASCTAAYNTPIADCTTADFLNNAPCSNNCVGSLEPVFNLVNSACQGAAASPTTLIGMIFLGKGLQALCPNGVIVTILQTTQEYQSTSSSIFAATSSMAAAVTSSTEGLPTIEPPTPAALSTMSTTSSLSVTPSSFNHFTSTVSIPDNTSPTRSSAAVETSVTAQPTSSNSDETGGSPFDITLTNPGSITAPNRDGVLLASCILGVVFFFI